MTAVLALARGSALGSPPMARTPDPKSKAGFVRSQPRTLSISEIVTNARAAGLELDARYVSSVRSRLSKDARATVAELPATPAPARAAGGGEAGNGLVAEIERIVDAKIREMLKRPLGDLLG